MFIEKIIASIDKTNGDNDLCIPIFFRIYNQSEKKALEQLLDSKSHVKTYDTIFSQLRELIKSQHPSLTFTQVEIEQRIQDHLKGMDILDYGVWVYYPWVEKVVHLLDEKEFKELRTNRNKYKITEDEQNILGGKIVGVVGLSVGQSVSITMAIERTFGELRIADFDELEITNLNRLRSGVQNMGLKKTVQVAREIAEIDPFLKVTLFSEGLTKENMDAFFSGGGKLDLIIDECDGLDMKILLRHKAKALRIPVLMEASDRGTVDVERFDLEPDRPLLHGFIDHLDHTIIGSLTNEEKIPYILPMLGAETISQRLKASMVEVKQSISTWPQLASAVMLGGALCADVYRRIMLDQYKSSGRYFVDIEELIGDVPKKMEGSYEVKEMNYPELTIPEMKRIAGTVALKPSAISEEDMHKVAEAAVAAPSAANNQPWKLLSKDGVLYLFHDKKQSYSWTDEEDFIAQISLGAALENIEIEAASLGYKAEHELFPAGKETPLAAVVFFGKAAVDAASGALARYINYRCTNRKKGDQSPVAGNILEAMKEAAQPIAGATLSFLTDPGAIASLAAAESAAERIRSMHPQSHAEFFKKELRWNDSGTEVITEGLDIKTLELTLSDETGMRVAADPGVIALLNIWRKGKVFEKGIRNSILSSSAVGLVSMPFYSPENYINGGRAAERIWLSATKHQLAVQPISAPLFLYSKIKYGSTKGADANMISEINELYGKLRILFPELNEKHGIFLFRLFNASEPTARSLRKPIEELYNVA